MYVRNFLSTLVEAFFLPAFLWRWLKLKLMVCVGLHQKIKSPLLYSSFFKLVEKIRKKIRWLTFETIEQTFIINLSMNF